MRYRIAFLAMAAIASAAYGTSFGELAAGKTGPGPAAAAPAPTAGALTALAAKYEKLVPLDKNYRSIWDDAQFKAMLVAMMGKARVDFIYKRWGGRVESNPIFETKPANGAAARYEIHANKPHDGVGNAIDVYVTPGKGAQAETVQIYFCQQIGFRNPAKGMEFGTGMAPKALPASDCNN